MFRVLKRTGRDGSFEYPQHMFWLRNKKNNFLVRTLTGGLNKQYTYNNSKTFNTKGHIPGVKLDLAIGLNLFILI